MSFADNLKKSLGFEEEWSGAPLNDFEDDEFMEEYSISPEQSFYEIILIKPKSMDDMDYVYDQIVEENNPVILDLSYLEKKGINEYRMAGERLKILREQHSAEAILLSQTEEKNLVIVTPSRVHLIKKD